MAFAPHDEAREVLGGQYIVDSGVDISGLPIVRPSVPSGVLQVEGS